MLSEGVKFLKKIVKITKVLGNRMNKGYHRKENMAYFDLEILAKLFDLLPMDENEGTLFTVVMEVFMKVEGEKETTEFYSGVSRD